MISLRSPSSAFLTTGTLLVGTLAVLASVAIHPAAGLGVILVVPAIGLMGRYEFSAVQLMVFVIALIQINVRVPGAPFLYPPLFLVIPLLAIVLLRTVLHSCGPLWSGMHTLILIFLGVLVASSILSGFSGETFREMCYAVILPLCVFAIAFHSIREEKQVRRLLDVATIAAALVSLYGILEFAAGRNWLFQALYLDNPAAADHIAASFYATREQLPDEGVYRIFSTFVNPIELATYLGMIFSYPVLAALHHRSPLGRVLYALAALVILLALFLTFSRGAMIALGAVLVVLFLFVPASRGIILATVVLVLISLGILYSMYSLEAGTRIRQPETVSTRLALYRLAFFMFLDHPVLGVGFGNFKTNLLEYVDRFGSQGFHFPPEWWTLTENTYLHYMSEMGVLGLVAHLAILAAFFSCCVRLFRRDAPVKWHGVALGAGGVAYAVNGLGSGSANLFIMATQLLWLQIALAFRLEAVSTGSTI